MYTANIIQVREDENGIFTITAEASNGTDTLSHVFHGIVSKEGAEQAVCSWVHSLQLTPPTVGAVILATTNQEVAPTPEELKLRLIQAKEAEIEEEIRRVETEKKRAEIALVSPVVAQKLSELTNLKSTK